LLLRLSSFNRTAVNPSEEVYNGVLKQMPLGRWGEPNDAARLISWLVSDEAVWITGQVINSEGGFRGN
jgi:3-oxoacyl-[acyl-carrier protein] reductase